MILSVKMSQNESIMQENDIYPLKIIVYNIFVK